MKCNRCPLYRSWSNESDEGEECGLFGDGWDSQFQYEDKDGNIVGCYIARRYIEKVDNDYSKYLEEEAENYEKWMIEMEGKNEDNKGK